MQGISTNARWAEFDSSLAKLVDAANSMRQLCYARDDSSNASPRDFLVHPDAPYGARSFRDTVLTTLAKLQMLVAEPSELLSQLAMQVGIPPHVSVVLDTEL